MIRNLLATSLSNRLIMPTRSLDLMQSSAPNPKRPVGVAIIAIVAAAGGLLSLFGGASVLAGMASGPFALAIIVIIFGILASHSAPDSTLGQDGHGWQAS